MADGEVRCAVCGAVTVPGARRCASCGADLTRTQVAPEDPTTILDTPTQVAPDIGLTKAGLPTRRPMTGDPDAIWAAFAQSWEAPSESGRPPDTSAPGLGRGQGPTLGPGSAGTSPVPSSPSAGERAQRADAFIRGVGSARGMTGAQPSSAAQPLEPPPPEPP